MDDVTGRVQPASRPKIHPDVTKATQTNQRIKVFVVLADQAENEIVSQVNQRFRIHELVAEGRLHKARSLVVRDSRLEEPLKRDLETITLTKRRFIFQELNARYTPQQEEMELVLSSLGATGIRHHIISNMLSAELPGASLYALESDPRVLDINLVTEQKSQLENSVPITGAPFFWSSGFAGEGESVAFLDSGAYAAHPAFGGKVVTEIFTAGNPTCSLNERLESDNSRSDFNGHGTHVGGIIGSLGSSQFPNRLGMAKEISTLFNLKISCEKGSSFDNDTTEAVEAALRSTSLSIINNSNGGPALRDDDIRSEKVDGYVDAFDLLWVNSCGNNPPSPRVTSPGTAFNTICVANWDSTTGSRRISTGSSLGPTLGGRYKPDLAAPGTSISSLDFRSIGYVSSSGTSMAAPHVAGAAALIRQAGIRGRLGIKALLLNSTDETGWQPDRGWGYMNLANALRQKDNVFPGELSPAVGNFLLLQGSNPISVPFKATVVWNRFVRLGQDSFLRDVNLHLYDATSNTLLAESTTRIQNVEQVSVVGAVQNFVIKVSAADSGRGWTEPFALSLTAPAFKQAIGPRLNFECTHPQNIVPANPLSLTCSITNLGDLVASNVTIEAAVVGSQNSLLRQINDLRPGASQSSIFSLLAPSTSFSVRLRGRSRSFGEDFLFERTSTIGSSPLPGAVARPSIRSNGVVDGFSFFPIIAPMSWVTVFGTNLAARTRSWESSTGGAQLPTQLEDVSVTVNGRNTVLSFVSPDQVNLITPHSERVGDVEVVVRNAAGASEPYYIRQNSTFPAFYAPYAQGERRYVTGVAVDGTYVGKVGLDPRVTRPVRPGEMIQLFGTGFGATIPRSDPSQFPSGNPAIEVPPTVFFGDHPAEMIGNGNLIGPGLYSLNVKVPQHLGAGEYQIIAQSGQHLSSGYVYIAVE